MPLDCTFTDAEVRDLRVILDRAMNTWEPGDRPKLADEFSEHVDRRLKEMGDDRVPPHAVARA